jgi:glyoxylase-like metal-dependent hydrolase (beta-lactamase superfamily II)
MKPRIDRRFILRTGLAMAGCAIVPRSFAAARRPPSVRQLGERLTLIQGAGGNVVALQTDDGLLLVDSGAAASTAALRAVLRSIAKGSPVRTVINTHWHADQTGGNDAFGKAGATLISHAKCAQRLAVPQYLPVEDRYLPARRAEAIPSKVFYAGTQPLTFGAEHIDYGYLLEAHTDGDVYVHFRDANVLVVGGAAAPDGDPELAWYEGGWLGGRIDALAQLLTIGDAQTRVIAASGGVVSRAELKTERDALDVVFTRMSESIRKGMTTEDMQKAKLLDGLPRTWADPDRFIYAAHKGMWANHNKLSHQVV